MMRLTIRLKKRALNSDLEKLRCAIQELKEVVYEEMTQIPPSSIRKMRKAGINAAQAGRSLRKCMKKLKSAGKKRRRG